MKVTKNARSLGVEPDPTIDPSRISIHELRARLARLRTADVHALSVRQFEERVGRILDQIPLRPYPLELTGIYRARVGSGYSSSAELWYPPASVCKLGRLNDVGHVVLYAANTPHTALFELRPSVGQTYTVLIARTKESIAKLDVFMLGLSGSQSSDVTAIKGHLFQLNQKIQLSLGRGNYKKYALLDKWLTSAITAHVSLENQDMYKPTAALGNLLFGAPIDAITYPSVAADKKGINIALLPNRADELFTPSEAWEIEILGVSLHPDTKERLYKVQPRRKTASIDPDGSMHWKADGAGVGAEDLYVFARGYLEQLSEIPIDQVARDG